VAQFRRETATSEADLPHEFQEQEKASEAQLCVVCETTPRDPRHRAWERQQLSDRERAQAEVVREIGS
jgi:hypothetical protein